MGIPAPDSYDIILLYLGFIVLVATIFPRLLSRYVITAPVAYLLIAGGVFLLVGNPLPHIAENPYIGKRLTEAGVIISLTAAGLKLRRPFAWKTWRHAAGLLAVTMPLTVLLTALFGWGILGFVPATAVLIGAVIAPTDPVLASDIQTSPPLQDDTSSARLALTTEAGLNDGLAFPFTNMAIAMALAGVHPGGWFAEWFAVDVLYKIIAGTAAGALSGWLLALMVFRFSPGTGRVPAISVGLLSLSLTLFPYGLAEVIGSYGFVAVFVAACVFRQRETGHEYLGIMHDFSEELERILIAVMFTLAAMYAVGGFLRDFRWYMIPAALVLILAVRPAAGLVGLLGSDLPRAKKYIVSFYGIRGIGSIYYLLYAFCHAEFQQSGEALALVTTVIILSVFIHGLSARPVMKRFVPGNKTKPGAPRGAPGR